MHSRAATLEQVKQRLMEAADSLRRLRMSGLKPGTMQAQWPEIVRRVEEAYGWTGTRIRPRRPSPAEISRMDEAIGWLLMLDADQRRIVWARAMGLSWRRLEDMDGRSIRTLQNVHAAALDRISCSLLSRPKAGSTAVALAPAGGGP